VETSAWAASRPRSCRSTRSPSCGDKPVEGCAQRIIDGIPETELFDLTTSTWVRLPHLAPGPRYSVADPSRYVDPTSGTVLIRFVNDQSDSVGFSATVSIRGIVR